MRSPLLQQPGVRQQAAPQLEAAGEVAGEAAGEGAAEPAVQPAVHV